ncbi:MAG: hypothetical protein RBR42_06155 [Desulfomicrobium sp.]|nr:hypothetical protein [Desulfomicrobium sp.]
MNTEMILSQIFWPLGKLLFFVSLGLFVGNLIEALHWTRHVAKIARPLARMGRLGDISAASFSIAFVSGITANTMLAEAYDQGNISRNELILSNLFNSLPTYFLHLPTMVFITVPILKSAAYIYLSITVGAALLRTLCILFVGRAILVGQTQVSPVMPAGDVSLHFFDVLSKTWRRFTKRIKKILLITAPIYVLVHLMHKTGVFTAAEQWLSTLMGGLSWLNPQAMGIVVFQLAAEFSAGMAAAGALLEAGSLPVRDVVLALVLGNILSSPMRAFRHQFPYYAGIYKPQMAMRLIIFSQGFRIASLVFCALVYAWWAQAG